MKAYIVILNGKKHIVKAPSWFVAFRLAMAGLTSVPRSLVIKPVKKRKITAFEQTLPNLLKQQAF